MTRQAENGSGEALTAPPRPLLALVPDHSGAPVRDLHPLPNNSTSIVMIANLATRLSCGTRGVKHIDRLIQSPRDVRRCAPDAIPTGHPATYPDIASYTPSAGEPPTWRMILITSFTLRMNTLAAMRANDASDADPVPGNPRQRVPRSRLLGHEKGSSSQASLMLSASVPEHVGHTALGEEPRTRGTARI
jgi:hypothetical protein